MWGRGGEEGALGALGEAGALGALGEEGALGALGTLGDRRRWEEREFWVKPQGLPWGSAYYCTTTATILSYYTTTILLLYDYITMILYHHSTILFLLPIFLHRYLQTTLPPENAASWLGPHCSILT